MAFRCPGPDERLRAIGPIADLPAALRLAFAPTDDFDPVPAPARTDWLSVAPERGQTFERFARTTASRADDVRSSIYLQPLSEFSREATELLHLLQRFTAAFFVREVRLLPPVLIEGSGITTRRNRYTEVLQLKTRDVLPFLAGRVPPDACCVLGVAVDDLYQHDRAPFVLGEAVVDDRVGVFSLVRYDPRFYDKPVDATLMLRRTCKVLAHEICHMLGMRHCIFFNCLMNGSNHLAESDRRPLHLCPIDLRKLQWSLGLDLETRYRQLAGFWREAGVVDEAEWCERRLGLMRDSAGED